MEPGADKWQNENAYEDIGSKHRKTTMQDPYEAEFEE